MASVKPKTTPLQRVEVPTAWLVSVLTLLNVMAGEGVGMLECADPADLMVDISQYLGCGEAEDPWEASLLKLREAYRG